VLQTEWVLLHRLELCKEMTTEYASGNWDYETVEQIAKGIKFSYGQLQFISRSRRTITSHLYRKFWLVKKPHRCKALIYVELYKASVLEKSFPLLTLSLEKLKSCCREISAPTYSLMQVQRRILFDVLNQFESTIHPSAHGFRTQSLTEQEKYSIVTNARPHQSAEIVINLDLKDFFSSIKYPRVKRLFHALGCSEFTAEIFASICCIVSPNKTGYLPQGAPTSPIITNLICQKLDEKLQNLAELYRFTYTRYADDLTFSCSSDALQYLEQHKDIEPKQLPRKFLKEAKKIIASEGFQVNKDKIHIAKKHQRQEVTGIVVNRHLNISRKRLKQFRAVLHKIEQSGAENVRWGSSIASFQSLYGFASYISMVNPQKGDKFKLQLQNLKRAGKLK
jgi:RNA-directed DNA polymerase